MMPLLLFIFYLFSLGTGILTVGVLYLTVRRYQNRVLNHFLKLQAAIVAYSFIFFLWYTTALSSSSFVPGESLDLILHILIYAVLLFLVTYLNALLEIKHARIINAVCTTLLLFYVTLMLIAPTGNTPLALFLDRYDDRIAIVPAAIYILAASFFSLRKASDPEKKRVARIIFSMASITAPLVIVDSFLFDRLGILVMIPTFFTIWNISFFRYCAKSLPLAENAESCMNEKLLEKAGITPREKEIITRLINGEKYSTIAERQCIAMATVKTHVTNIYRKFSVSTRHELSALLFPKN